MNTSLWYKQVYYRNLTTDFYQRFGTIEDINLVKEKCRLSLSLILRKFRRHLTREDFLSFNLGANLDDYIYKTKDQEEVKEKCKMKSAFDIGGRGDTTILFSILEWDT